MEGGIKDAVSGGAWLSLGNLIASLTGFLFAVIIARLVGVDAIGVASVMASSASIGASLAFAGMGLAVAREAASGRFAVLRPVIVLSLLLGATASLISAPLASAVSTGWLPLFSSLLAFLSVFSQGLASLLWGLELFRAYSSSQIVGSTIKLISASLLAFLGFKLLSPIIGYLSYPFTIVIIASFFLLRAGHNAGKQLAGNLLTEIFNLAKLGLSNYPYGFSNQLLTVLSVYFFAYIAGSEVSTGTLYLSLMITVAIAAFPSSIINASLPINVRRGEDSFGEAFRLGMGLIIPVTVFSIIAAKPIIVLINPALLQGVTTLRLLLLGIPALIAQMTALVALNRVKAMKELTIIGGVRLSLLVATLIPLVRWEGITGAAISFLTANTLTLPLALKYVKQGNVIKNLLLGWSVLLALSLPSFFFSFYGGFIVGAVVGILSLIPIHLFGGMRLTELIMIGKIVIEEFKIWGGKK